MPEHEALIEAVASTAPPGSTSADPKFMALTEALQLADRPTVGAAMKTQSITASAHNLFTLYPFGVKSSDERVIVCDSTRLEMARAHYR